MEATELQDLPGDPDLQGNGHQNGNNGKTTTNEKAILLEKKRRVSIKSAVHFRSAAIIVSWISCVVSLILGSLAIGFAWKYDSQSLFSFGLDAILDCISSAIILWRYHGGDSLYSDIKERRACVFIGVLFILSALILSGKSIAALVQMEYTEKVSIALILTGINVVLCLVLGTSKVYLGYKLESMALTTDSITTLVGAAMSVFTLIFTEVYRHHTNLWFLDDAFGILCSLFLLMYGIRVIYVSWPPTEKMAT